MEAALWESCNKLRGAVEPAEYKHVVLSLIFLKYAGDRFELRKQELIDNGLQEYVDQVEFYTQKMSSICQKDADGLTLCRTQSNPTSSRLLMMH